ncbi:MAG TPA: OmpA family protein [Kofleriaceae bacterium]|nr:OmpA family protein [Kofleriaceae bacterium]
MRRVTLAVLGLTLLAPAVASAEGEGDGDYLQLGGFFGPRLFSSGGLLGYNYEEPAHPDLKNMIGFGARIGKPFGLPWLVPELELVFVPTKTTTEMNVNTSVVWLEPRVHARIDLLPQRRMNPFILVGGGSPIAISSARKTFNSGIVGEGYFGAGIRFDSLKGFVMRFDARISAIPSAEDEGLIGGWVNLEGDINFGIELSPGKPRRPQVVEEQKVVEAGPPADKDADGIPDTQDRCPDRAEDQDNFEDADGCPDIDNDGDRVLDIADKCEGQLETINGYADDDGCPDSVPADVDALKGSIEGLLYAEGETAVRESATKYLQKIAKVMMANPSIRVVLIGHTDDREAKAFATPVEGQPPPDVATIATDLARARAEAVRQAMATQGIPTGRVVVDGVGAEDPVADNSTVKGRLANRRVEIKLYVPK